MNSQDELRLRDELRIRLLKIHYEQNKEPKSNIWFEVFLVVFCFLLLFGFIMLGGGK